MHLRPVRSPSSACLLPSGKGAAQAGFTLIELMIALVLATAISAGLVVAFRLGLQYVERGQQFYSSLQESFAMINLLRRELHVDALVKVQGNETSLTFSSTNVPDGHGRAKGADLYLRCTSSNTQPVSLQLEQMPLLPAEQPGPGKEPPPREPDEERKTVLLDRLAFCGFEFLVRGKPAIKDEAPTPAPTTPAAGGPPSTPAAGSAATANEAPEPTKAEWQNEWKDGGKPLAIRLRIGTNEQSLPPVVFPLVK